MTTQRIVESAHVVRALLDSLKTFCISRRDQADSRYENEDDGMDREYDRGEYNAYSSVLRELDTVKVSESRRHRAFAIIVEYYRTHYRSRANRMCALERYNAAHHIYCTLTGEDSETVYEQVQETMQAEHERSLAERDS